MQNKAVIFFILSFIYYSGSGQKFDFNWLIGYSSIPKRDSVEGHTMLRFNTNSGNLEFAFDKAKNIEFFGGNSISFSDTHGNYLFSFNGDLMEDSLARKVNKSDSLCYFDPCWLVGQSSIVVPIINSMNKYYLFNVHMNDFSIKAEKLSYTCLRKNSDGSIQFISEKKILIHNKLDPGRINICRHANGRDWWLIVFEDSINSYYSIIIDQQGPKISGKYQLNSNIRLNGFGYSSFSPDGKYYASFISEDLVDKPVRKLEFYNFDRCNGNLSNYQTKFFYTDKLNSEGSFVSCEFSPNSRFLYICEGDSLFQFSISHDGNLGEKQLIDTYDGFRSYLFNGITSPTKLQQIQLAPDGKIYCNPTLLQTREYHVINRPNLPGKACDFRQHSLRMPALKYSSPSFPNYRLGPIDGSTCDTLGIDNIPWCWWRYEQDTSNYLCFEFTDLSAYEVAEWYWDFGDGTQSSDTSPTHCYAKKGIYQVCLIVKNQNGADTLCRTLNIGTSSVTDHAYSSFELFPNVVQDYCILNVVDYIPERAIISVIDLQGKEVIKQRAYQGSNTVQTEDLIPGIYIVSIMDNARILRTFKIIKD